MCKDQDAKKVAEAREEVQERKDHMDHEVIHEVEDELKKLGHKAGEFIKNREAAIKASREAEVDYILEDEKRREEAEKNQ